MAVGVCDKGPSLPMVEAAETEDWVTKELLLQSASSVTNFFQIGPTLQLCSTLQNSATMWEPESTTCEPGSPFCITNCLYIMYVENIFFDTMAYFFNLISLSLGE